MSGLELMLHRDLDLNEELRDAGWVNIVAGAFGGIPAYHAVSLAPIDFTAAGNRRREPS